MNDLSFTKIGYFDQVRNIQLVPKINLVFNILKDVVGYLVLGNSYHILLSSEFPFFANPNGRLRSWYVFEVIKMLKLKFIDAELIIF